MNIATIRQKLGYTDAWMDLGVVDEAGLIAQWEQFCSCNDKHEEHYRWHAAREYLKQKSKISDEEICRFLDLTDEGTDGGDLSSNRAIELIEFGPLSWAQFLKLAEHPIFQRDAVRKRHERMRIANCVSEFGILGEVEAIKASDDSDSHLLLLSHEDSPMDAIEWLVLHGKNKAIRHRAEIRLRSFAP